MNVGKQDLSSLNRVCSNDGESSVKLFDPIESNSNSLLPRNPLFFAPVSIGHIARGWLHSVIKFIGEQSTRDVIVHHIEFWMAVLLPLWYFQSAFFSVTVSTTSYCKTTRVCMCVSVWGKFSDNSTPSLYSSPTSYLFICFCSDVCLISARLSKYLFVCLCVGVCLMILSWSQM